MTAQGNIGSVVMCKGSNRECKNQEKKIKEKTHDIINNVKEAKIPPIINKFSLLLLLNRYLIQIKSCIELCY